MLERLGEWMEVVSPEFLKRIVTSDALIQVDKFSSPPWYSSEEDVAMLREYISENRSTYYPSVLDLDTKSSKDIQIDTDELFTHLDIRLLGVHGAEELTVEGEFFNDDGASYTDSIHLNMDNSFNLPGAMPVTLSSDKPVEKADIRIDINGANPEGGVTRRFLSSIKRTALSRTTGKTVFSNEPRMSIPAPRMQPDDRPPILVISVDSLRYDAKDRTSSLRSIFDGDAIIPTEPRTNGHWTPPSHATMLTGVHPGDHKYLADGDGHPIHPDLDTIPEILQEKGYKCSGIVSRSRLSPQWGFGRGFYRYELRNMTDWLKRDIDSRSTIDEIIRWIGRDDESGAGGLFYFIHLFDPHLPYIPDHPSARLKNINLGHVKEFTSVINDIGPGQGGWDPHGRHDDRIDDEVVEEVESYYWSSVEYTFDQIRRLVSELKSREMYDDALIIVTGDHGEAFGENATFGHDNLYNTNIKPFMLIKPPESSDWSPPETPSTIDFLPTIAREVGANVPDQCQGTPWQETDDERTIRITERIREDQYNVSVEKRGAKGIFTFDNEYPGRPEGENIIDQRYENIEEDDGGRQQLRDEAREFVSKERVTARSSTTEITAEKEEQLRKLGYK